ncbi:hypothetical protein M0Q97_07365 [Candidatus Dojkabacteria bacterium]|jgi:hypothetical protein|nr:hypothetical protein [Candidatus Dojkabacteria bacterium]
MFTTRLHKEFILNNVDKFNYVDSWGIIGELNFNLATIVQNNNYNTTIYQDKTDEIKLSYMDGGVMQIVDVTA